jgi:hypothetical protein
MSLGSIATSRWLWIALAICLFLGLVADEALNLYSNRTTSDLNDQNFWMALLKIPTLKWLTFVLACVAATMTARGYAASERHKAELAQATATSEQAKREQTQLNAERFSAQLTAAQLVSPINDRGHRLDVELEKYLKARPFDEPPSTRWTPVVNTRQDVDAPLYMRVLTDEATLALRLFVFLHGRYVSLYLWNKPNLGSLPVFFATSSKLVETDHHSIVRGNVTGTFEYREDKQGRWPPARAIGFSGGPTIGFESLSQAIDHLAKQPTEPIFVMSADAPNHPKFRQTNESATLLILNDGKREMGRRSLAQIHRPIATKLTDADGKLLPRSERVRLWKETLTRAAALGGIELPKIKTIMTDLGKGTEAASERTGLLGQVITESIPDFEFLKQAKNLPGWLGDLGAATVGNNVIVGAFHAYRNFEPVLVVGTTDESMAHAVLIRPAADQTGPMPPRKPEFATSQREFNRLWWGARKDGREEF